MSVLRGSVSDPSGMNTRVRRSHRHCEVLQLCILSSSVSAPVHISVNSENFQKCISEELQKDLDFYFS